MREPPSVKSGHETAEWPGQGKKTTFPFHKSPLQPFPHVLSFHPYTTL